MLLTSRPNPDTADVNSSVWTTVNRVKFERELQMLYSRQHVAGPRDYTSLASVDNPAYPFPVKIEQQLADDLAFICAYVGDVRKVSAVAIECNEVPGMITVRLAANEGVENEVKEMIDLIMQKLEQCSSRRLSRLSCAQSLFEAIVELNTNRILGRLGSRHHKPPAFRAAARQRPALPKSLRTIIKAARPRLQTEDKIGAARLNQDLYRMESAFEQLERAPNHSVEQLRQLRDVVFAAFELTQDGKSFHRRLQALGAHECSAESRAVRQVHKIANYWRISYDLAKICRIYRHQFFKITWGCLEPYQNSRSSILKAGRHIHAEIQLLVYYETAAMTLKPRALGVSKEACFLCDSFIRAHSEFAVSKAHRQTFVDWTVPDLNSYSSDTVVKFRQVLKKVCLDVSREVQRMHLLTVRQQVPHQSSINLNMLHLSNSCISTLISRESSDALTQALQQELGSGSGDKKELQMIPSKTSVTSSSPPSSPPSSGSQSPPSSEAISSTQPLASSLSGPASSLRSMDSHVGHETPSDLSESSAVDGLVQDDSSRSNGACFCVCASTCCTFTSPSMILSMHWAQIDTESKMRTKFKKYTRGLIAVDIAPEISSTAEVVDIRSLTELVLVRPENSDNVTCILNDGQGSILRLICRWD